MTSQKDWFHEYEHILGVFIYMGDDHALKIVDIVTIKINMLMVQYTLFWR